MQKIQKLSDNAQAWNDNVLPQDLFNECFDLALYETESRNEEDQLEQKDLWIRMFECTQSYEEGLNAMHSWLQVEAFQHSGKKTHKVLQFLQESCQKVTKKSGKWNLWYDALKGVERARDSKNPNVPVDPEVKQETNTEKEFWDVEVEESQFRRLEKLNRNFKLGT